MNLLIKTLLITTGGILWGTAVYAETTTPQSSVPSPTQTVNAPLEPMEALPPLPDDLDSLVEPITPDEVKTVKRKLDQLEEAVNESPYTPVPKISSQTVSLSAGSAIPQVRVFKGNTTSITFSDVTGAPWGIAMNPVNADETRLKVMEIDKFSPAFTLQPLTNQLNSNVTVMLKGLPTPVVINVITATPDKDKKTVAVDYRVDLRLPLKSPDTPDRVFTPEKKIDLYDKELQAFLDGVPPQSAKPLSLKDTPRDTKAWLMGDDIVLRTPLYLRDEFSRTLSSIDGTHVYVLTITPEVMLSDLQSTRKVKIDIN